MNRSDALALVKQYTKNPNLIKHMLAVEANMRALARYFKEDEELWGVAGLLHDLDYEMFKDEPSKHPSKVFDILVEKKVDEKIIQAIKSHAWRWQKQAPEPNGNMEWALYCCDDLTGFVIACALVRPDKKLASVKVKSIKKKWPQKAFAAGVHRDQVALCEKKLGIPLEEFWRISLESLQGISGELGL